MNETKAELNDALLDAENMILPSGKLSNEFCDLDNMPMPKVRDAFSDKLKKMVEERHADNIAYFVKPAYLPITPIPFLVDLVRNANVGAIQVDLRGTDWHLHILDRRLAYQLGKKEKPKVILVDDTVHLPAFYDFGLEGLAARCDVVGVLLGYPGYDPHAEEVLRKRGIHTEYVWDVHLAEPKPVLEPDGTTFGEKMSSHAKAGIKDPLPYYFWALGDYARREHVKENDSHLLSKFSIPGLVDVQRDAYAVEKNGSVDGWYDSKLRTYTKKHRKLFSAIYSLLNDLTEAEERHNANKIMKSLTNLTSKIWRYNSLT